MSDNAEIPPRLDDATVVIFCADGDTGYRLSRLLRHANISVAGVVRQRADRSLLEKMSVDVVTADPTNRQSVEAVFGRYPGRSLFVVCMLGGTPQLNTQGNIFVIDAAKKFGASRFVLLTSIGCGDSVAAVDPFVEAFAGKALRAKNWAETHLKNSGLAWTIIRPGGMMRRPFKGGPLLLDSPNITGYINPTDLGDAIFSVLLSTKTEGRTLTAVDADQAIDITGEPLVAAEL
jgi:uncharacterized protein YbjT (DUF2867 family)